MATLAEIVMSFCRRTGIPIAALDDDPSTLITRYAGDNDVWRCIVLTDDDAGTVVVHSLPDVHPAPPQRTETIEFLARASAGLPVGSFDYDFDADEISFRTSVDVTGGHLTDALVSSLLRTNLAVVDHYLPALRRVADGELRAVDAIHQVDPG